MHLGKCLLTGGWGLVGKFLSLSSVGGDSPGNRTGHWSPVWEPGTNSPLPSFLPDASGSLGYWYPDSSLRLHLRGNPN